MELEKFIFYLAHYNTFWPPEFHKVNVYILLYIAMGVVAFIWFLVADGLVLSSVSWKKFGQRLMCSAWVVWVIFTGVQTLHQAGYWQTITKRLDNSPVGLKYYFIFGYAYDVAHVFNQAAPSAGSAMLFTDVLYHQSRQPYVLRYFLFPKIDLMHPTKDPEYIVFYRKADRSGISLEGYEMIIEMDRATSLWRKKDVR